MKVWRLYAAQLGLCFWCGEQMLGDHARESLMGDYRKGLTMDGWIAWLVPVTCLALGVILSLCVLGVDRRARRR